MDAVGGALGHNPAQRVGNPSLAAREANRKTEQMTFRDHIIAALVLLAAVLSASTANAAFFTEFDGTRAEIRTACAAPAMEIVETAAATYCIHNVSGITVSCTDAGICTGAGPLALRDDKADGAIVTGTVN